MAPLSQSELEGFVKITFNREARVWVLAAISRPFGRLHEAADHQAMHTNSPTATIDDTIFTCLTDRCGFTQVLNHSSSQPEAVLICSGIPLARQDSTILGALRWRPTREGHVLR